MIDLGADIDPIEDLYIHKTPAPNHNIDGILRPCVPAIALPLATKPTFVMPNAHHDLMLSDLARAEKVLVIGWKAGEESFLKEWAEAIESAASNALIVVTPADADLIGQKLSSFGLVERYETFPAGFSSLMADPTVLHNFLNE